MPGPVSANRMAGRVGYAAFERNAKVLLAPAVQGVQGVQRIFRQRREHQEQQVALARQQQGQDPQQAQQVRGDETPQQREQRQALEAWMRRVPDDPGSLLRTKFRLEQERRQREQP